jgi:hypothetical protein
MWKVLSSECDWGLVTPQQITGWGSADSRELWGPGLTGPCIIYT